MPSSEPLRELDFFRSRSPAAPPCTSEFVSSASEQAPSSPAAARGALAALPAPPLLPLLLLLLLPLLPLLPLLLPRRAGAGAAGASASAAPCSPAAAASGASCLRAHTASVTAKKTAPQAHRKPPSDTMPALLGGSPRAGRMYALHTSAESMARKMLKAAWMPTPCPTVLAVLA